MALIPTVTKKVVTKQKDGRITVTLNLSVTDDVLVLEVINQDFVQDHNPGNNISVARDALLADMQDVIDRYKSEQQIFNAPVFTDAVTYIQNNLVM